MSHSLIIDLAILAVLALSLWFGWSKGMIRGLLTLAAAILSIAVASQVGDILSDLLIEQVISPAAHSAVEQYVIELDPESFSPAPLEEIGRAIDTIENELVREKARELLSTIELPAELIPGAAKDTVLTVSSDLVDAVLHGAVREILSAIICLIGFIVISFALRPVIWLVEKAFQLPLLRQVNQIGGLISGAVRGVLLVLIAVWGLRLTGLYITDEVIAESYLLKYTVQILDFIGASAPSIP